ncbi:MAG: DUF805 domain-containing protein [Alphaproteobacteria bacterium]
MITLLFDQVRTGRAGRLAFVKGLVVLALAFALATVVLQWLFIFAEGFSAGGAPGAVGLVVQLLGFALAGVVAALALTLVYAFLNLIAKRLRDIGLPAWKALTVIFMLGTAFSLGTPPGAAFGYIGTVWLLLFFLPAFRPRD